MKIVHCTIHYMPFHIAGTEVYTHTLAKEQQRAGLQVAVITPHIEYIRPGKMQSHYVYDGIDVYEFLEPGNPQNPDLYTGLAHAEGIGNFIDLLNRLQPDVVQFHELNLANSFSADHVKAAKQWGAKVVVTMHLSFLTCHTNILVRNGRLCEGKLSKLTCSACSYQSLFGIPNGIAWPLSIMANATTAFHSLIGKGKIKTLLSVPDIIKRKQEDLRTVIQNADQFVALTNWYRNMLLENGVPARLLTVIPQGLTIPYKKDTSVEDHDKDGVLRLIFIGRLQPQKNVLLLIEAVKKLDPATVHLDIYGKDDQSDYCKHCIAACNNTPHIRYLGILEREQVPATIARYDVLCLPSSFSEMSPLVIQEAFAAGIPVVASKVYGNIEQVQHLQNGLLFDFNDGDDLTRQLQLLISQPALLAQMKQHIHPPADFSNIHQKYLQLYKAITGKLQTI